MQRKLIAEALGTFVLALTVLTSIHTDGAALATPVAAALVLMLFVYSIGARSGCHINPAVTLGLLSIKKIKTNDAISYIVAQVLGAVVAFGLAASYLGNSYSLSIVPESMHVFIAELIGAAVFAFGIAAVVYERAPRDVSGVVVGGSLLLGITLAVSFGSAGILNPAVAVALGSLNLSYVLGSVVGSVIGFNVYKRVVA
jgi:aquaporin Z